MIPATLEEAFQALSEELGPEGQIDLMRITRDDLITTHHELGRWIRNNWDLWKDGPLLSHMGSLGFSHPDDISHTIIKEYWLKLNGLPSEMEQDKLLYKEYWDKVAMEAHNEA